MNKKNFLDSLRLSPWLVGALLAVAVIALIAPHQLGVLVWNLSKLSLGAYLGYWIDRSVFHYARPHELNQRGRKAEQNQHWTASKDAYLNYRTAMLRRAIVMAAAIVALGLGI